MSWLETEPKAFGTPENLIAAGWLQKTSEPGILGSRQ
jgi:hypothetical protein